MAHTLDEVDTMVNSCAAAGVPLNCGAITTTDPSFGKAKELLQSGAIGELLSIEANGPGAQHQGWSYFLDSEIDYCVGFGHSGAVRSPPPLQAQPGPFLTSPTVDNCATERFSPAVVHVMSYRRLLASLSLENSSFDKKK